MRHQSVNHLSLVPVDTDSQLIEARILLEKFAEEVAAFADDPPAPIDDQWTHYVGWLRQWLSRAEDL